MKSYNILGIDVNFSIDNPMELKNVIYIISFKGSDKKYIGQTSLSIYERTYGHIYQAIYQRHDVVDKAILKYKSIVVDIICKCKNAKEMDEKEAFYISTFNSQIPNGYNIKPGGSSSRLTDEQKAKIINH